MSTIYLSKKKMSTIWDIDINIVVIIEEADARSIPTIEITTT